MKDRTSDEIIIIIATIISILITIIIVPIIIRFHGHGRRCRVKGILNGPDQGHFHLLFPNRIRFNFHLIK